VTCVGTASRGELLQSLWEGYRSSEAWLVLVLMAVSGAGAATLQSRVGVCEMLVLHVCNDKVLVLASVE
jgi:hypothetical protein